MDKWLKMISAKKPLIEENTSNANTANKQNGRADPCLSPIMNSVSY